MRDWLKKWILNRWQYKLAAFFTALVLWFYVVGGQNLNINLTIPVEFINYPADLQVVNKIKNSADITVQGRRDIITKMEKKDIKAVLDLKNSKAGKNNLVISAAQIKGVPRGLLIRNISPAAMAIEFAPLAKQEQQKNNGKNAESGKQD